MRSLCATSGRGWGRPPDRLRAPVDAVHVNEIGAGGLVIAGETNGHFVALADATGDELYKINLGGANVQTTADAFNRNLGLVLHEAPAREFPQR